MNNQNRIGFFILHKKITKNNICIIYKQGKIPYPKHTLHETIKT